MATHAIVIVTMFRSQPASLLASCIARMTWKQRLVSLGFPWDFSGTFSCIKGHERETTERPFPQVSGWRSIILAGQQSDQSLPGYLRHDRRRTSSAPTGTYGLKSGCAAAPLRAALAGARHTFTEGSLYRSA